jgi:hypothetical protein
MHVDMHALAAYRAAGTFLNFVGGLFIDELAIADQADITLFSIFSVAVTVIGFRIAPWAPNGSHCFHRFHLDYWHYSKSGLLGLR